jgi:hypothetical protein
MWTQTVSLLLDHFISTHLKQAWAHLNLGMPNYPVVYMTKEEI